jgi:hypothetical protein
MTQLSNKSGTSRETPPRCDRMLGQDAGHYVRCILGLGHPSHHIGYGPRGDIQTVTWVQNDPRETIIVPPELSGLPPLPEPPLGFSPQQKAALLALVLMPPLPTPPTTLVVVRS